jgi:hypothetical protein
MLVISIDENLVTTYESNDAEFVRQHRNKLLAKTDWAAGSDVTMSDAMRTYRQALRDIPQQTDFPNRFTIPNKPE